MRRATQWLSVLLGLCACYQFAPGPDPLHAWAEQTLALVPTAHCMPLQRDSLYVVCHAADTSGAFWVRHDESGKVQEVGRWWVSNDSVRLHQIRDSLVASMQAAFGGAAHCAPGDMLVDFYRWARSGRYAELVVRFNDVSLASGAGTSHCRSWRGLGPPWPDPERFIGRPEPAVRRIELDSLRRAAP